MTFFCENASNIQKIPKSQIFQILLFCPPAHHPYVPPPTPVDPHTHQAPRRKDNLIHRLTSLAESGIRRTVRKEGYPFHQKSSERLAWTRICKHTDFSSLCTRSLSVHDSCQGIIKPGTMIHIGSKFIHLASTNQTTGGHYNTELANCVRHALVQLPGIYECQPYASQRMVAAVQDPDLGTFRQSVHRN